MKTITMSTRYIMYVCKPYTPVGAIPIKSTLAPNWQNIKVLAIFSPLCIPLCAGFPIYQKSRSALKQAWPASYSPLFMSFNNDGSCLMLQNVYFHYTYTIWHKKIPSYNPRLLKNSHFFSNSLISFSVLFPSFLLFLCFFFLNAR